MILHNYMTYNMLMLRHNFHSQNTRIADALLKKRIIPILLFRDYSLVKGINFKSDRIVGGVIENIILFDKREVDEIIFLDIDSTLKESKINYSQVNEISNI